MDITDAMHTLDAKAVDVKAASAACTDRTDQ